MSNLSIIVNDNQANLKGAVFHFKAYAIVLFICGGLIALLGLPLLLLFGLGIIYIAFGVLYIFLGLNMLNASKFVKNIIGGTDLSQDDYNANSMNAIVELKKHFKILNIMMAVFLGLGLLGGILAAASLPALINEINKNSPRMMDPSYQNQIDNSLPGTKLNSYVPNPGNKSASEMGMTDKEHSELHDPKNIVNTDYSQLDYGNADAELKASQDAVKKAMQSMTPEQKASMEKMMGEIKN
jgi:hypothetical protein